LYKYLYIFIFSDDSGLSGAQRVVDEDTYMYIGIAAGCLVLVAVAVGVFVFMYKKYHRTVDPAVTTQNNPQSLYRTNTGISGDTGIGNEDEVVRYSPNPYDEKKEF